MSELKCPHCGQVFTVDESEMGSIVRQIRDAEFEKDLNTRIRELEKHMQEKHELEMETAESKLREQMAAGYQKEQKSL